MPRRFRHRTSVFGLLAVPVLLALGLVVAPAVQAGDPCYHDFTMPPATTGIDTEIELMSCAFTPTVSRVATGSIVTFRNGSEFTHLVTGANQDWGSRDAEIKPGETVSYRFDSPGVYPYACALHRGMSGAIVVGDANETTGTGAVDSPVPGDASGSIVSEPALVVLATSGGVIAGAVAVWFVRRRRMTVAGALIQRS